MTHVHRHREAKNMPPVATLTNRDGRNDRRARPTTIGSEEKVGWRGRALLLGRDRDQLRRRYFQRASFLFCLSI